MTMGMSMTRGMGMSTRMNMRTIIVTTGTGMGGMGGMGDMGITTSPQTSGAPSPSGSS